MSSSDCAVCCGEGQIWIDDHDPSSRYGHTQYPVRCDVCGGDNNEDQGEPLAEIMPPWGLEEKTWR